ncbi:hypothetical protein DEU56DRAFT_904944 [Suillus clintonianus]|uniref:uncharacterized protein n=1 Tax=Suillus clintonianus TaxID=1904413 RepID=UPI001B8736C1|nr:uncharacterized protein DEU56DRAFT_904944 [Suillus clintonianus]KAG2118639.1 hypothetical protein DEU56DRAFT_904944 [Suillus clintonianus]
MDAFSCSVRLGAFTTAVELVEQGRAVFWRQLARFRTPLDELSLSGDAGAALADDFKQLSFRIREVFDQSNEDHSPQIRQLIMQWEDVVSCIRMMPGFVDALSQTQWLHLACHVISNRRLPFESCFTMRHGSSTIKDIIRSHWQHPEFAFLSSSRTAVGEWMSPDESINLAAAMQFSGFRSVIGSLGNIEVEAGHQVESAFYGKPADGSGRLDCTQAAVALHKAMKSLRKKIPLEQLITFVHIGLLLYRIGSKSIYISKTLTVAERSHQASTCEVVELKTPPTLWWIKKVGISLPVSCKKKSYFSAARSFESRELMKFAKLERTVFVMLLLRHITPISMMPMLAVQMTKATELEQQNHGTADHLAIFGVNSPHLALAHRAAAVEVLRSTNS